MIFMFYILVFINYVGDSSNYVLQRINQNVVRDVDSNDKHLMLQDGHNNTIQFTSEKTFEMAKNVTSTESSNLLLNLFDRKLSNEMLSIKQNLYSRAASKKCASLTFNNAASTLEQKQKWPVEDLLSQDDDVDKNINNGEDFEFRLLPKEHDMSLSNAALSGIVKSTNDIDRQHNESNNKVVDLRSLSNHLPLHINDLGMAPPTINPCTCSPNSFNSNWGTAPPGSHNVNPYPHGSTPHGCNDCTRTTVSFTFIPYYIPSQPPAVYYPPNIYTHPPFYAYYYDYDKENEDKSCDHNHKHHKKTTKKDRVQHDKDYIADLDYDVPRGPDVQWNTAFFEARPNKLVKDLIDDLIRLYPDSVIKKCYCSSSSNIFARYNPKQFYFYLFFVIIMIVKVL